MNKNNNNSMVSKVSFRQFAGFASCANCHKNIYEKHLASAHFFTSHPASEKYIKGSFETGKNIFAYDNNVAIVMDKRDDGFYQVEYNNGTIVEAWRVAVGSGTLGQSALSWRDNMLFQLPITYFATANQWSNSTGIPGQAVFNRTITSRCLECHNTFARTTSAPGELPEKFDSSQIIYSVGCEKCHGPAAEHVKFQTENPNEKNRKIYYKSCRISKATKA